MNNLLESYKVLGVKVGAGLADVTTSYKQLCRIHHPDVSEEPNAEEMMKEINLAYTVLREKFKREATVRERPAYTRPTKRYNHADTPRQPPPPKQPQSQPPKRPKPSSRQTEEQKKAAEEQRKAAEELRKRKAAEYAANDASADKAARVVLKEYFKALNSYDYAKAYTFISEHDKGFIREESFIEWREAVAKLYPMREFKIADGSSIAMVTWDDNKTFHGRKFRVNITEDDFEDGKSQSGEIDKLIIHENENWRVFLGYKSVQELIKTFDERFESKKRRDYQKRWEDFHKGVHADYDMDSLVGIKKSVSRELYRHRRYGGSFTFAAISIKLRSGTNRGFDELLRSAAKTINSFLRETDIPAYAGDGVFVIMFTELRKKDADAVINRMIETIRKNAGSQLGGAAGIDYVRGTWTSNSLVDIDSLNNVLHKFNKKM